MGESRTKNTFLNAIFGIIGYVSVVIISFALRKVFASVLGAEYLGLNSLYTTIVSFLSLTELGLSTAIIYFLYKPLNIGDKEKIKLYLNFYKKAYRVIAAIVLFAGGIVTFILPYIAKTTVNLDKVRLYFILYVINTSVSYLIAYKKSIIYADQKARAVSVAHALSKIIFSAIQIMVLYYTESFLLYIIVMIVCTVAENVSCAIYADVKYPYIKEKSTSDLTKEELREIKLKMIPIALQSLAGYVVTSTDSIIISAIINVGVVGVYSNYTLISSTLKSLYGQVFAAFTSSFGNLSVSCDTERAYYIYDKAVYLAFFMSCCMATCFASVVGPFIDLCFGSDYVLDTLNMVLIAASFYFTCMNVPAVSVQNALGLHSKDMLAMVAQGVFNLVVSLVLVHYIGLSGVIIGTILSTAIFPFFSKDYVLHKYFFNTKPAKIYLCQSCYLLITILSVVCGYYVCNFLIVVNSWLTLIRNGFVALGISVIIIVLTTFWTSKFKYFISILARVKRKLQK